MNERDRALIREFKTRCPDNVRCHLKKIIVFGSRARDDAAEHSDLDIIALVDEKNTDIEKKLEDIAYSLMLEHDFDPIISLKVFELSRYDDALRKGYSFYRHIETEGIAV